jgi:hypothetical protein
MLGQLVKQEVERLEAQGLLDETVCDCAFCNGRCVDEGPVHVGKHVGRRMVRCKSCAKFQHKGQQIEPMG